MGTTESTSCISSFPVPTNCLDLVMPSTTGFTNSRWDGLGAREILTRSPSREVKEPSAP